MKTVEEKVTPLMELVYGFPVVPTKAIECDCVFLATDREVVCIPCNKHKNDTVKQ